jgi:hypothetical protein
MKKLIVFILSICFIASPLFAAPVEVDYMEYSSDANAQAAYVTNGTLTNHIPTNSGFETWSGGANALPDGWTSLNAVDTTGMREGTIKKVGTYSAKIYNSSSGGGGIYQDCHAALGINYWKGKTVTVGVWVYSTGTHSRIIVSDGVSDTSTYETVGDSTWRFITHTKTISSSATQLRVYCYNDQGSTTTTYFDNVFLAEGNAIQSGNNLVTLEAFSESTIKTQGSYALKAVAAITASLNKTLTKTFSSPIDLSGVNTLKLDMRASRTGANVKLGLHNATEYGLPTQTLSVPQIGYYTFAFREHINANQLTGKANRVKVILKAAEGPYGGLKLTKIYIGHQASSGDAYDFDGNQVEVKFAGGSGVTIAINTTATSDWTTFALDDTKNLIVSFDVANDTNNDDISTNNSAGGNFNSYYKVPAAEAEVTNVTGYSVQSGQLFGIVSILGDTTTELTPTISSADTYETKSWDISAVANADKNAIDKFIITPTNADAANTMYFDWFDSLSDYFFMVN